MKLTPKETATVLAALRAAQDIIHHNPKAFADSPHFEKHDPLTEEEIDDLCMGINRADLPDFHSFEVQVKDCNKEQAIHVMRERLGHDEEYGFPYTLNW